MQAFLLSRVVDSLLCELFRLSDFGGGAYHRMHLNSVFFGKNPIARHWL
jgi:hypothetical protein